MLYPERMRQKELAEREAAGEDVWTKELEEPVRWKLWYAITATVGDDVRRSMRQAKFYRNVQRMVRERLGTPKSSLAGHAMHPSSDVRKAIETGEVEFVLAVLEAASRTLRLPTQFGADGFEARVNEVFRLHRCSYELVGVEVVPFESQEMHDAVVAPTLRLLSGRPGWEDVEQAYQDALKEIGDDASDAITDAGTALQEALKVRGCKGNALGPLLKDAKAKGILAPHDPTLGNAIGKLIDWAGADRSELGDGHKAVTGAQPQDAWLAVHVVGALILRLARGDKRPSPQENGGS